MSRIELKRPPWWRPIARRAWDRARIDEQVVAIGDPDALVATLRGRFQKRSEQRRARINAETDQLALEADMDNGVPMFTVQRALRNREGEQ